MRYGHNRKKNCITVQLVRQAESETFRPKKDDISRFLLGRIMHPRRVLGNNIFNRISENVTILLDAPHW